MRTPILRILCLIVFAGLLGAPRAAELTSKLPEDPTREARMAWFKEAKFGMFIHWGLYAVPAGEWNGNTGYGEWIMLSAKFTTPEYEKFAPQFNPTEFNAKEWVAVAKAAGMKYMVITAKHHDGFAMYDSKLTDYDIVDSTPFKRDPLKELADACKEAGITFCVYYSIVDWHHPEFPAKYSMRGGYHGAPNPEADINKYVEYQQGQLRELLTNYGPIGLVWFDHGGSFRGHDRAALLKGDETVAMMKELQPNILINNRLEAGIDFGTPEQKIPAGQTQDYFEACMTLNKHWGWNKADNNWKEAPEVIQKLTDIASKGGNFLLNVGPKADGTFPEKSVEILKEVGQWIDKNGEAIYGTQPSPLSYEPAWGRVTAKGDTLYAHVFAAPENGELPIAVPDKKIVKAALLDGGTELKVSEAATTQTITLPAQLPDAANTVVKLELAAR